jgi:hypothetical protein
MVKFQPVKERETASHEVVGWATQVVSQSHAEWKEERRGVGGEWRPERGERREGRGTGRGNLKGIEGFFFFFFEKKGSERQRVGVGTGGVRLRRFFFTDQRSISTNFSRAIRGLRF